MIDPESQNDLGREVVANLGELPGFGRILWWDGSGSQPLDGATSEWGIDVKAVNRNDPSHRYEPEDRRSNYPRTTKTKNEEASNLGLQGILGVLVVLDYRTDMAEIHVKEMPLRPHWFNEAIQEGSYGWQKYNAPRLLESVPFKNPYKDWRSQVPNT